MKQKLITQEQVRICNEFLNYKPDPPLCNHVVLNVDFVEYLKTVKPHQITKLFKSSKDFQDYTLTIECKCDTCGFISKDDVKKTHLYSMIEYYRVCQNCRDKEAEKERKNQEVQKIKNQITISNNTEYYIDTYLDPFSSWNKDANLRQAFYKIEGDFYKCNVGEIEDFIKNMSYDEFLETPFWKAISYFVKYRSKFKCEVCNSNEKLVTHHKTYENHGKEISCFKDDLICLCSNCHEKYHEV